MSRGIRHACVVAAALGAAFAPAAHAVHWPQLGGDPGRSGYQPLGDGTPQVQPLWGVLDPGVVTSPIVTAGRLTDQRVVYGTSDGRVHLRRLLTGDAVGPPDGVVVEDVLSAGVFGDGGGGSASFAETSTPGALGAVLVVHNARNSVRPVVGGVDDDVEITVVDEGSGGVVQNVPVPGSADHAVSSSAVLSPPDGFGIRRLLFVASTVSGSVSLFSAEVMADRVGRIERVEVPGAAPLASPALAYLRAADGVRLHAVVATSAGLRTFLVESLSTPGPSSSEPAGALGTPAVPVSAAGLVPGQADSDAAQAPAILVAAGDGAQSRLYRLEQQADRLAVTARSEPLAGAAAPALALAQEVVGGVTAAGWAVVTTSRDLYALDARRLAVIGSASASPGAPPAGFAATTAAGAGRLAFVSRADGMPEVIDLQRTEPLGPDDFVQHPSHAAGTRSIGQPAISRGLVIFTSDAGAFAYRTRCGNPLGGTASKDVITGSLPGDAIAGRDGADKIAGGEGDDCLDGGRGADALRGDSGQDALSGSEGDDRLNGGAGNDVLTGGPGRDRLSGAGGADRLAGGVGPDTLSGGDHNDRILARGGGRDRIMCGRGRDTVSADRADRVARDCERVARR